MDCWIALCNVELFLMKWVIDKDWKTTDDVGLDFQIVIRVDPDWRRSISMFHYCT